MPVSGWSLFDSIAQRIITNFDQALHWRTRPRSSSRLQSAHYDYVIVTNSQLAPIFQELAMWKCSRGISATVVTTEWINQTYADAGPSLKERIRAFLRDAYATWNTTWALLGGDCAIIPAFYWYMHDPYDAEIDQEWFPDIPGNLKPTDQYYACLDGSWDADGDGLYGEAPDYANGTDEVDWFPELFIGRAPVNNETQARAFVHKTILADKRELNRVVAFIGVVVFYTYIKYEEYDDFWIYDSIDVMRLAECYIPDEWKILRLFERCFNASRRIAIRALNGELGPVPTIVLHSDHGSTDAIWEANGMLPTLLNIDAEQYLKNRENPFLLWAVDCLSGAWDWYECGHGSPYVKSDNNSIAEHLTVYTESGAFAYIGSARIAYGGSPYEYSDALMLLFVIETFANATYPDGYPPGYALTAAKLSYMAGTYGLGGWDPNDESHRKTILCYNLMGDPELRYGTPVVRSVPTLLEQNEDGVVVLLNQGESAAFYTVLKAGDTLSLSVTCNQTCDVDLYVYDPQGNLVLYDDAPGVPELPHTVVAQLDGVYKIRVYAYLVSKPTKVTLFCTKPLYFYDDLRAPLVTVLSPGNKSTVQDRIHVVCRAIDSGSRVEAVLFANKPMRPSGVYMWSLNISVESLPSGVYRFPITAYDTFGNRYDSMLVIKIRARDPQTSITVFAKQGETLILSCNESVAAGIPVGIQYTILNDTSSLIAHHELFLNGTLAAQFGHLDELRLWKGYALSYTSDINGTLYVVIRLDCYPVYHSNRAYLAIQINATCPLSLHRYEGPEVARTIDYDEINNWIIIGNWSVEIRSDQPFAVHVEFQYDVDAWGSYLYCYFFTYIGIWDDAVGEWIASSISSTEAIQLYVPPGSISSGRYMLYLYIYVYGYSDGVTLNVTYCTVFTQQ